MQELEKVILDEPLCKQYDWFFNEFATKTQEAGEDFFLKGLTFKLVGLSKNINVLSAGTDYFVTKIMLDSQHDIFFRVSQEAVKIMFDKGLGKRDKKFDINSMTDLEATVLTKFNNYLFEFVKGALLKPPPRRQKRKNYDAINLSMFMIDEEKNVAGKFIISLPEVLLEPENVASIEDKFNEYDFTSSWVDVKIKIGKIKSPVGELKQLDVEDIVVFDSTDIHTMSVNLFDWEKEFRLNPNPSLIMTLDDNEKGDTMTDNAQDLRNLWDKVLIEMGAEFERVKIPLGELKKIENGLIVDVSSVYNNKISLVVENKTIAHGELVIVNDRYGVKITEVFAGAKAQGIEEAEANAQAQQSDDDEDEDGEGGEFDYSDFELEDEDI